MTSCEEEDFTVEVLGILGNLTFPEIDFEKVITELDLLPFISAKLKVLYNQLHFPTLPLSHPSSSSQT